MYMCCIYTTCYMHVHVHVLHAVAGDFQDQDSLLEEPRLKAHNPRSYDTSSITSDDVPTRPTYLGLPLSHHELSPMSNPSPSPRPWPGHPEPNCETTFVDRRNEFHSLQRFIFLSFGVPGAPVLSTFAQRCSSKCTNIASASSCGYGYIPIPFACHSLPTLSPSPSPCFSIATAYTYTAAEYTLYMSHSIQLNTLYMSHSIYTAEYPIHVTQYIYS